MEPGLDSGLTLVIAVAVLAWSLLSGRLRRLDLSAPIFFVAVGLLAQSEPLSLVHVQVSSGVLRGLVEVTLALLLFSSAARVNLRRLRSDAAVPTRLLLLGLPLTIALGTALALLLFGGLDAWHAAVIAAAVAPTDAALGAQVVEDPHVPARIRRVLGVESGLNDGIATPFVTFFIAGAAGEAVHLTSSLVTALAEMSIAVVIGAAVGLGGGWLLTLTTRAGWVGPGFRELSVLALALVAYAGSLESHGNGFIAAFVAGLAYGAVVPERHQPMALDLDEQVGNLLSYLVWFAFGAVVLPTLTRITWQIAVFAVLAVTVVRMLPVAVALLGTHLSRTTVAFVGWFGPRGLASVVFGLIAYDSLTGSAASVTIAAIALTVVLSVLTHGVTARPLSRRYGDAARALHASRPEHREPAAAATGR